MDSGIAGGVLGMRILPGEYVRQSFLLFFILEGVFTYEMVSRLSGSIAAACHRYFVQQYQRKRGAGSISKYSCILWL